jgi:hypothetical protein
MFTIHGADSPEKNYRRLAAGFKVLLQSKAGESGLFQGLESQYLYDQRSHGAVSLNKAAS